MVIWLLAELPGLSVFQVVINSVWAELIKLEKIRSRVRVIFCIEKFNILNLTKDVAYNSFFSIMRVNFPSNKMILVKQ